MKNLGTWENFKTIYFISKTRFDHTLWIPTNGIFGNYWDYWEDGVDGESSIGGFATEDQSTSFDINYRTPALCVSYYVDVNSNLQCKH